MRYPSLSADDAQRSATGLDLVQTGDVCASASLVESPLVHNDQSVRHRDGDSNTWFADNRIMGYPKEVRVHVNRGNCRGRIRRQWRKPTHDDPLQSGGARFPGRQCWNSNQSYPTISADRYGMPNPTPYSKMCGGFPGPRHGLGMLAALRRSSPSPPRQAIAAA